MLLHLDPLIKLYRNLRVELQRGFTSVSSRALLQPIECRVTQRSRGSPCMSLASIRFRSMKPCLVSSFFFVSKFSVKTRFLSYILSKFTHLTKCLLCLILEEILGQNQGCGEVVEHMLLKWEALGSNPNTLRAQALLGMVCRNNDYNNKNVCVRECL